VFMKYRDEFFKDVDFAQFHPHGIGLENQSSVCNKVHVPHDEWYNRNVEVQVKLSCVRDLPTDRRLNISVVAVFICESQIYTNNRIKINSNFAFFMLYIVILFKISSLFSGAYTTIMLERISHLLIFLIPIFSKAI
jgi:hypothetical protein